VLIEPGFARARQVPRLSHPGESDEPHTRPPRLPTNHFRQLDSIRIWHVEIDEGHVRSELRSDLEGAGPVETDPHRVSIGFQQRPETVSRIDIVIHDEDPPTRLRHRWNGRIGGALAGRGRERQMNRELTALARPPALRLDLPTMQRD